MSRGTELSLTLQRSQRNVDLGVAKIDLQEKGRKENQPQDVFPAREDPAVFGHT